MSDDITFCWSFCDNEKCFRHPSNIREPRTPHSFAHLKDTEDCPMKETDFNDYLNEQLKDPEFKKEFDKALVEKVPLCIHYKVCERREYCNDNECEDYKGE